MTNEEFLRGIYGNVDETERALWVCTFASDPVDDGRWKGQEYRFSEPMPFNALNNNYGVIATLKRDKQLNRDEKHFGELCTFVLDDINTKVPIARLPNDLAPTWRIETSPANFQYGYKLTDRVSDPTVARRFIGGLMDRQFTDPGAGHIVRYYRLPVGANTKASVAKANGDQPFQTSLHEYEPERVYTLTEAAEALGVDLSKKRGRPAVLQPLSDKDDSILAALIKHGMLNGQSSRDGWLGMTCPWGDGHNPGHPSSTAYKVGGGFRCLHGHCADRNIGDLLKWLESKGEQPESLIDALPTAYRALLLGVRDYAWSLDIKRFVHLGTSTMIDKDALNDYHASSVGGAAFAQLLLRREDFRRYRQVTFRPGRERFTNEQSGSTLLPALNLWSPGPIVPASAGTEGLQEATQPWLDHLAWLFPAEAERAIVLDFLTHIVQRRGDKINWALVMVAQFEGTGRDTLMAPIISILGNEPNVRTVSGEALSGDFNEYAKAELVYLSELDAADETLRKIHAKLKAPLTTPPFTVRINEKNIPAYWVPKVANYIIVSNSRMVLPLTDKDRRFCILETRKQHSEIVQREELGVYRSLHAIYAQPGWLAKFAGWLLARKISDAFDAKGNAPDSLAKLDLVQRATPPGKAMIAAWIDACVKPFDKDLVTIPAVLEALRAAIGDAEGARELTEHLVGYYLADSGAVSLGQCSAVVSDERIQYRLWAVRDQARWLAEPSAVAARRYKNQRAGDF